MEAQKRGPYYGWYVLPSLVAVSYVGFLLYLVSLSPVVTDVQQEFGWSRTETVGAYSFGAAVAAFGAPFFGWLIDRVGGRRVMFLGAVGMTASCLCISWADGMATWYIGWVGLVIFQTFLTYIPCNKVLTYWFKKRRGTAMGLLSFGGGFSYMGAAIWGALIMSYGWRQVWFMMAWVPVAVVVLALLVIRDKPEEKGWAIDGVPASESSGPTGASTQAAKTAEHRLQQQKQSTLSWIQ